jgi:hypothetical protein
MLIYSTKYKQYRENLEDLWSATKDAGLEANSEKFMCYHTERVNPSRQSVQYTHNVQV